MFGVVFTGHPDLRRILMPDDYTDFPLRKGAPALPWLASPGDTPLFSCKSGSRGALQEKRGASPGPEDVIEISAERPDTLTINMGPSHPATHGVLRVVLELDGETVVSLRPDLGFSAPRDGEGSPENRNLPPVHPLHRPDGLPQPLGRERRLRAGGRGTPRDRGSGALPGSPA